MTGRAIVIILLAIIAVLILVPLLAMLGMMGMRGMDMGGGRLLPIAFGVISLLVLLAVVVTRAARSVR